MAVSEHMFVVNLVNCCCSMRQTFPSFARFFIMRLAENSIFYISIHSCPSSFTSASLALPEVLAPGSGLPSVAAYNRL